jgi:hypothetical protein
MCYFIVLMSSLLFYNVENSQIKENPLNEKVVQTFDWYCIYIYSAFGKYSDPFPFYTFCHILKWIHLFIFLINLHTIPINDQVKTGF